MKVNENTTTSCAKVAHEKKSCVFADGFVVFCFFVVYHKIYKRRVIYERTDKKTKKRIFLMAPIHYHFEKKGLNETSVVGLFALFQLIFTLNGILALL